MNTSLALREVTLEDKYRVTDGQVFLTGVQALVRLPMLQRAMDQANGLNTAGFVSGYPGSPLASYDVQLRQAKERLAEAGVFFQPGLNEDLAMTSVWGSQQGEARGDSRYDGVFAIWYGKGAGLDRSGDALRHGNLAGASKNGGVLLLLGDDHRAESSSVTHYAEYTMVDFMMPVLNPSNVLELIEFGLLGFAMSRYTGTWVGLKSLHDVVESAESVRISSRPRDFRIPDDANLPPDGLNLRYPDTPLAQEQRLHRYRLDAIRAFARANAIDRAIWRGPETRMGIVTTGKTYLDVLQALDDLGIGEERARELGLAIYKVAMPWPLEPSGFAGFAAGLQTLLVVEEKRPLMELQIKEQLFSQAARPRILGKSDEQGAEIFPAHGVLNSNQIALQIVRWLLDGSARERMAGRISDIRRRTASRLVPVIPIDRKPSFCSGCPHNRSTVVPEGSRGGAGTGCNYMSMWMDRGNVGYTQMGADGANWIGEAPFSHRTHVFQSLGDGTYAHSGLLAIRASVAARVNITFKVLFNSVVAMTGGQPHDFEMSVPRIAQQVAAEGASRVVVVADDPGRYARGDLPAGVDVFHRDRLESVQRELREIKGVTVLIYDQMCATEKRRRRKRGLLEQPARRIFINHLVCEGCGDCGVKSSCTAVLPRETPLGRKREIDQSACNMDYSCVQGFCPSFVSVIGGKPRQRDTAGQAAQPVLADPPSAPIAGQYNIVLTGIGGTGVITLAAVLGMAAHLEGKGCSTLDMMGLAQKGGTVTSHVRIANSPQDLRGARVPGGAAHLVLGCDLLALVSPEPLSSVGEESYVLANDYETMPAEFARKPDLQFPSRAIARRVEAVAGPGQVTYIDATQLARRTSGNSIYANTLMLGFAFQKGWIPLSASALERAFELNGTEVQANKRAFHAGRQAALDEAAPVAQANEAAEPPEPITLGELVEERAKFLAEYQNERLADDYRAFVGKVEAAERSRVPGSEALARAVASNLSKLLAYKDEYEVGRLYTSGAFASDLQSRFEGKVALQFHLAPPLLARRYAATGEIRKMTFGPWILPVFRLLARMRGLRGTPLDPFGYTQERRTERKLIADYQDLVSSLLPDLDSGNIGTAAALAAIPEQIRGFGHVKAASIRGARLRQQELLEMFNDGKAAPATVSEPLQELERIGA